MHELKLFGGAVLEVDGDPVDGAGARRHPVALLAILATAPRRALPRTKLAGLLWPESPERVARNRLNTCLYQARSAVGDSTLRSIGADVRLEPGRIRCDVFEFESALETGAYAEAVERYSGPLLDGFSLPGSPEFEQYVERHRARHRTRYHEALEALAEDAERRGEPARAAAWWRRRSADDPYSGRVVRQLMEALAASGNRAEAVLAGERHLRRMRNDLDVPADETVRSLLRQLREGTTADGAAAASDPRTRPPGRRAAPASGADGTPSDPPEAAPGASPVGAHHATSPRRPGRIGWRAPAGVTLTAGLLVTVIALAGRGGLPDKDAIVRSVAVLPFESLDGSDGSVMLARAVTEEITTSLSEVPELVVKSRASASRFLDSDLGMVEFSRALDVALVIRGSVRREDDRIRVLVHFVEGRSGDNLWARSYEGRVDDLFRLQVDVARQVADRLAATFSQAERDRILARATGDSIAYQLYLRAEQEAGLSSGERISLLRSAVERDSSFWSAWVALANGYVRAERLGEGPAYADSARRAFDRALAHADPWHVPRIEALQTMVFREGDAEETLARLRAAVERHPSDVALVATLKQAYQEQGRLAEAARWGWQAARLDPLSPLRWRGLYAPYAWAGLYDEGRRVLDRALALGPDGPGIWMAYHWLWMLQDQPEASLAALDSAEQRGRHHTDADRGYIHWWHGDLRRAAEAFDRVSSDSLGLLSPVVPAAMASTFYATGDSARAREIVRSFERVLASQTIREFEPDWRAYPRLQLAALEGDTRRAVELLHTYVELGGRDYHWIARSPLFRDLVEVPAFRAELDGLRREVDRMARAMEQEFPPG